MTTPRGRAFSLLLTVLGRLPLRLNRWLGSALGHLFGRWPNRNLRIARRNLAMCFPDCSESQRRTLLRRTFVETGKGLTELGWFWRRPVGDVLGLIRTVHGKEVFDDALAAGRGVLLAAPHLGAWELLCQYLASRGECSILYREPRDAGIEAVVNGGRGRLGAELVRAGGLGVRRLYRALAEGRIVGILPDQQPKRGNGVFAPFFGMPALTMVLFSRLAARARAPVVFAWARRLPGTDGYDLHFGLAPPAVSDPDLDTAVAALNAQVEQLVRECPEQYQWGYKRFSIRPEGEAQLY